MAEVRKITALPASFALLCIANFVLDLTIQFRQARQQVGASLGDAHRPDEFVPVIRWRLRVCRWFLGHTAFRD